MRFVVTVFFFFFLLVAKTKIVAQTTPPREALPESTIDIPIRINLKPFFALAEKKVDTVFTSPGYPAGWVQADCATRYKYHFRRTPLRLSASGTTFQLAFTGLYKIVGSTRVCANGAVLSPWTPECRCGFSDGERKVNVGFTGSFILLPNYLLSVRTARSEPQPLNKCTVCFWGQDITKTVMQGLKEELDLAKKAIDDSFGVVNLRPYLQQAWNKLNDVYAIPNLGYLSLKPQRLRMENIVAGNDFLNIKLGITASPAISFLKPAGDASSVPDFSTAYKDNGFNIHLEAALQYDSLSAVINGYLAGKRFDLSQGLFKRHVIIDRCRVQSDSSGRMVIETDFSGSHRGTVYFTGVPAYSADTKKIELQDFSYDLKTNDFLLKTAQWLFDKRIVSTIKKYTAVDLSGYYDTAATGINTWLNREWTKGIKGSGRVQAIKLTGVYALPDHLLVRSNCTGELNVLVNEINLNF